LKKNIKPSKTIPMPIEKHSNGVEKNPNGFKKNPNKR
jgi:hypothetical protein